jgi:metal-dependent hydrolase (beta-lactamase superfamily II)
VLSAARSQDHADAHGTTPSRLSDCAVAASASFAHESWYVFVSHGHGDHAGGAPRVQELTGATVGMAAEDWVMTGEMPDLI